MWRKTITKLLSIADSPDRIAKGFALGSFIGMMPISGLQMLVSLSIATILKINRKAACIAVFNTNVFTGAFVFAFNYWLGSIMLGRGLSLSEANAGNFSLSEKIASGSTDVILSLILGGLFTGIISAALSYFAIHKILTIRKLKIKEPEDISH